MTKDAYCLTQESNYLAIVASRRILLLRESRKARISIIPSFIFGFWLLPLFPTKLRRFVRPSQDCLLSSVTAGHLLHQQIPRMPRIDDLRRSYTLGTAFRNALAGLLPEFHAPPQVLLEVLAIIGWPGLLLDLRNYRLHVPQTPNRL